MALGCLLVAGVAAPWNGAGVGYNGAALGGVKFSRVADRLGSAD